MCVRQVRFGKDRRQADLPQASDHFREAAREDRCHALERLVEQQQASPVHHRAGERHELLLAAGEFRRPARAELLHLGDRSVHPRPARGRPCGGGKKGRFHCLRSATAEIIGREGGVVVGVDTDKARLEEVVNGIRQGGGRAEAQVADALDGAKVAAAVDAVVRAHGRIDMLINAVGGTTIIERPAVRQNSAGRPSG